MSYDDRFKAWLLTPLGHYIHAECRRRALALYRRGRRHYSIRRIWEGVRLDWDESGRDADGFKCNDHYHSRMARLLMDEEPELEGFFETRSLKT